MGSASLQRHWRYAPPHIVPIGIVCRSVMCLVLASSALRGSDIDVRQPVDYLRDVKPLLRERCFPCHGALSQESDLRLDTVENMGIGGFSGPAFVPGEPASSLIVERVTAAEESERMPPEGRPLSDEEIARIRNWIAEGAPAPENEEPESDPAEHWAFRTPRRPPLPPTDTGAGIGREHPSPAESASSESTGRAASRNSAIPAGDNSAYPADGVNPIDAFLDAKIRRQGLVANPPAEKSLQLRRVYLDLIGVPPSRDALQEFLTDPEPDAYERVVDRLLESPQHGERWARHWMDVWRYSDWYGRRMVPDVWNSAPQIWRWRDWIVRSLNHDKGYDQMIREMLAADELAPEDPTAAVATGYLIRNWYALNPNDWMRSNVEHTAKAFLGLTFNCAHCHDHKYDPIKQDDYFRLRAFLEPIGIRQDRVAGEPDPGPFQEYEYGKLRKIVRVGAVQVFDQNPEAPTWFYHAGDERNRVSERGSMAPEFPEFLGDFSVKVEPLELAPTTWYPGLREEIRTTNLAEQREREASRLAELESVRQEIEPALPSLRDQLAASRISLIEGIEKAKSEGRTAALVGKQSLLLDASAGRSTIQHGLENLESLDEGMQLRFQLQAVRDAHVNFQLAKDVVKGLTASFVAFDYGKVLAYQPGTFTAFEVGQYDISQGQDRFEVSLTFLTSEDHCLLTVRSLQDGQLLTDGVPVALNGWNPVGDPTKAITFDARPGAVTLLDEIRLLAPSTAEAGTQIATYPLISFDFEPPTYEDGRDVVGQGGWERSSFVSSVGTSLISATAALPEVQGLVEQVELAQQALDLQELKLQAAEARHAAEVAHTESFVARLKADDRRYLSTSASKAGSSKSGDSPDHETEGAESRLESQPVGEEESIPNLIRRASRSERIAAVASAHAEVLAQKLRLVTAQAKPASEANRDAEMEGAAQQLAIAREAEEKARTELEDPDRDSEYAPFGPQYPRSSTGRRAALARWLTHPEHPLTARVAINHIWLRHFHVPLVADVADFGRNGALPTHPELLDWLAVELIESGWSMKHIHRLIVTSQAYRRSSRAHIEPTSSVPSSPDITRDGSDYPESNSSPNQQRDPENQFLWRMNAGRMEAEVVRDSLLAIAEVLDLTMGGQELENSEALTTRRRTIYYSCHPELDGKSQFGSLFDAPDATECYRRTQSVVPQQALALTNSNLIHELSLRMVHALEKELTSPSPSEPSDFVIAAYEKILSRTPTPSELAICLDYLGPSVTSGEASDIEADGNNVEQAPANESADDDGNDHMRRRASLVRALMNHNDFVTIR